jgi:CheY-like chemotaxis protein
MARILVVDDSPLDRTLISGLLSIRSEWQIELTENGALAVKALDSFDPDLIVTDLQMPEMDGLQLVQYVRDHRPEIPVVLTTSVGSEQIAIDALRAGATSFSPKSVLANDLVPKVGEVLELSQRMRYAHTVRIEPAPKQIAFVLENDLSLAAPAIEHLQNSLPDWSNRDRLQIGMALDEALVNAMHHGNLEIDSSLKEQDCDLYHKTVRQRQSEEPYCRRRVHVEAEFSDQHICVQVSDEGPGFNPCDVPDPCDEANLHRVCGRGLFLIRSFMDQTAHNQTGNQITMTRLRKDC